PRRGWPQHERLVGSQIERTDSVPRCDEDARLGSQSVACRTHGERRREYASRKSNRQGRERGYVETQTRHGECAGNRKIVRRTEVVRLVEGREVRQCYL